MNSSVKERKRKSARMSARNKMKISGRKNKVSDDDKAGPKGPASLRSYMFVPDFTSAPDIRLFGEVNDDMVRDYYGQISLAIKRTGPLVFELATRGGDPDAARRIGMDIQQLGKEGHKEIYFLGKTIVYSAGVTLMGCFPKSLRYITKDTTLLIHERRLDKEVSLIDRPLSACAQIVQQLRAQIENSQRLEKEGFKRLAKGSEINAEDIGRRAKDNWYLSAQEAFELGLVAGLI